MVHDLCARTSSHVVGLSLKGFRCFKTLDLDLNYPIVLIEGNNGSGKTSILEGLYYACYLRSFRTYLPRDIIHFDTNSFFVRTRMHRMIEQEQFDHEIQIGYEHGKRSVKVDQRPVYTYKDLMHGYKIISLTEDDLELIKGSPESRRSFVDQSLLLQDAAYAQLLRDMRIIVDNRNACLKTGMSRHETCMILTEQLWHITATVQQHRTAIIQQISGAIDQLSQQFFDGQLQLTLAYEPKVFNENNFSIFLHHNKSLLGREYQIQRTLFGGHLDDIRIIFHQRSSRFFASRGQQKLIVLLMKIGQIKALAHAGSPVFLLDDYMTDFDVNYAELLLKILNSLQSQLIFTAPIRQNDLMSALKNQGAHTISLTL